MAAAEISAPTGWRADSPECESIAGGGGEWVGILRLRNEARFALLTAALKMAIPIADPTRRLLRERTSGIFPDRCDRMNETGRLC